MRNAKLTTYRQRTIKKNFKFYAIHSNEKNYRLTLQILRELPNRQRCLVGILITCNIPRK